MNRSPYVVCASESANRLKFVALCINYITFSPKTPQIWPAKMKKSNNSLAVEDRQNMSIEHEYKLGVTLSESVMENFVQHPLEEKSS